MVTAQEVPSQGSLHSVQGRHFFLAVILSLVGYYVLFAHLVHKPQTIGSTRKLFLAKDAALAAARYEQKIVLIGGSNVRTSHSARVIEEITGLPTVNMGVSAGLSIDFQLNRIKPFLQAGDIIYLSLEYNQLARSKKEVYSGSEAPYVVAYEKSSLREFPLMRRLQAYLSFDLKFLFSAMAEMGLTAMDFQRRITADDFNRWGDHTGHTIEKGGPYREYIEASAAFPGITVDPDSFAAHAVADFLDWASSSGVDVIGGWPTYAQGRAVSAEAEAQLKAFYESRGHHFLDLENKGRYPKNYFFDTIYHLAEPYQIEHSRLVGEALKALLEKERP